MLKATSKRFINRNVTAGNTTFSFKDGKCSCPDVGNASLDFALLLKMSHIEELIEPTEELIEPTEELIELLKDEPNEELIELLKDEPTEELIEPTEELIEPKKEPKKRGKKSKAKKDGTEIE